MLDESTQKLIDKYFENMQQACDNAWLKAADEIGKTIRGMPANMSKGIAEVVDETISEIKKQD